MLNVINPVLKVFLKLNLCFGHELFHKTSQEIIDDNVVSQNSLSV